MHADHGPHDSHVASFDSNAAVNFLELEGEVLSGFVAQAVGRLVAVIEDTGLSVQRLVDLGCGPGVGTCALAEAFESSSIIAVDGSPAMLERTKTRAVGLGHGARVETRHVDLNDALRVLGSCDVVWASMSIHHVADEVSTLRQIRALLEPHGLLCIVERDEPVLVRLGREAGRPGIWDRLALGWQRWFDDMRDRLPGATKKDRYPTMLSAAGFDLRVDRRLTLTVDATHDAAVQRFAARHLQRTQAELQGFADHEDLAVVRALLESMASSSDAVWDGAEIHATRKLFVASPRSA